VNEVNPLSVPSSEHTRAPEPTSIWERGSHSAPSLAALATAVTLTLIVTDTFLSGELGWFFDLGFIALCVALGLLARPGDFIVAGLLPPVVLTTILVFLGFTSPAVAARAQDPVVQVVVSGLSHHSTALFLGQVLCLGCLAYRQHLLAQR